MDKSAVESFETGVDSAFNVSCLWRDFRIMKQKRE